MTERYRAAVLEVKPLREPASADDYLGVGEDLLAPRDLAVEFVARIFQRATADRQEVYIATLRGLAVIRDGVAGIHHLEIDCLCDSEDGTAPLTTITSQFLERIPLTDIGLAVVARCSLTRWQEAHYVLEPAPSAFGLFASSVSQVPWVRRLQAVDRDEPMPIATPPKPVLIDGDGVPWYRLQVVSDASRLLSRQKRARVTPDFLRDVWTVYRSAQEASQPTTQAVRDWADARTGRTPSNPTIFRWIKEARALYGEEQSHA